MTDKSLCNRHYGVFTADREIIEQVYFITNRAKMQ